MKVSSAVNSIALIWSWFPALIFAFLFINVLREVLRWVFLVVFNVSAFLVNLILAM